MSNIKDFVIEDGVLKKYRGKDADVIIPDGVTSIGKRAFLEKDFVKSVFIPDGVIEIGSECFIGCEKLENVSIPTTVRKICDRAFGLCENLESIVIPEGVAVLSELAFYRCYSLKSIQLPESLQYIGLRAFLETAWLNNHPDEFIIVNSFLCKYNGNSSNVTIPEGVTVIGPGAFDDNEKLVSVTIPASVKIIHDWAFVGCINLTSLTVPEGVTKISDYAFYLCTHLKNITLPASLTYLGYSTFGCCYALEEFIFSKNITEFSGSVLELMWDKYSKRDDKVIIMYSLLEQYFDLIKNEKTVISKIKANKKVIVTYAIKMNTAEVLEKLFSLFKAISFDELNEYIEKSKDSVTISAFLLEYKTKLFSAEKQESIENDRTDKDFGLKEKTLADWKRDFGFVIKNGLVYITSCKLDAENVIIPEYMGKKQVAGISRYAFLDNQKIKSVILPEGLKSIGESAFNQCSNLETVHIPDTVTEISSSAFKWCTRLKNVSLPESLVSLGKMAFEGCNEIESITIPDGVTKIPERAFSNCAKLKTLVMSDIVTEIGEQAFLECTALENITISRNIKIVERSAFFETKWINNLKGDFIIIGSALYKYRGKEQNVIIPDGVKTICYCAFAENKNVESVVIPEGVVSIGTCAFLNCKNLKIVSFPSSLERMGTNAFEKTEFLKNCNDDFIIMGKVLYKYLGNDVNVRVPDGITCIAPSAFSNNKKKIEYIYLPDSLKFIEDHAFSHCYKLKEITIPDGVTFIGYGALRYCEHLTELVIPESVQLIGSQAFELCKSLKKAIFKGEPEFEEFWQFAKCNKELVIYTPKSSKTISLAKRYKTKVVEF